MAGRTRARWTLLGLLTLTAALYAPSLAFGYVYQDEAWIPWLTARPGVTLPGRGLALASHVAVGLRPDVDHLVNVALHLTNGGLVAGIGSALAGPAVGVVAAGVFLLHPLTSTTVAYLSARTDLLMTFGILLAVWLSLRRVTWTRIGLLAGACVLAAMSKEPGIVALGLVAWTGWRRRQEGRLLALTVCACVLGAGFVLGGGLTVVQTWWTLPAPMGGPSLPWGAWLSLQHAQLWHLVALVVQSPLWRKGFSIEHDALSLSPWAQLVAGLCSVQMVALAIWGRWPRLTWAVGWVILSLAPRFVFRTSEFVSEPHLYLPMAGISVGLGCLAVWLWQSVGVTHVLSDVPIPSHARA